MNYIIQVKTRTRDLIKPKDIEFGVTGENVIEKLIFELDNMIDGIGWLEYQKGTTKGYLPLTKTGTGYETEIKNELLTDPLLYIQLRITEGENAQGIPVFISKHDYLVVYDQINAIETIPDEYPSWLDVANAKIIQMNEALEEVDNLDIDVSKVNKTVTVSVTNKEDITKSETIVEPTITVSKNNKTVTITAVDSDGTTTTTIIEPQVSVSKSGLVATVTAKDSDGTTTTQIEDGATFIPSVDIAGNITWTNNKALENPTPRNITGPVGPVGPQGVQGKPFTIKKTYSSIASMEADFENMELNDFVMIASSVQSEDNAKMYVRGEEEWIFITDFSGAQGIQGEQGPQGIQGIQGIQGETGATGNGIASIEKTSTTGLVDTYTITYTNGNTTTFTVTNGFTPTAFVQQTSSGATISITDANGTTTANIQNGDFQEKDAVAMFSNAFYKEVSTPSKNFTINSAYGYFGAKLIQDKIEHDLVLFGESTQATRSGKNKFNINGTRVDGYATSTILNDTLKITTNTTGGYGATRYSNISVQNVTYHFTAKWQSDTAFTGTDARIYIYDGIDSTAPLLTYTNLAGTSGTVDITFTPTNSVTAVSFSPNNTSTGKVVNMEFSEIMISLDGGEYEQYGVSPSPEFPSEIESISAYNLFDEETIETGYWLNYQNGKSANANSIISDYISINNTEFYLSAKCSSSTTEYYTVNQYDQNKTWITGNEYSLLANTNLLKQLSLNSSCKYIKLSFLNYNKFSNIQLSTEILPYRPYGCIGIDSEGDNVVSHSYIKLNHPMRSIGEARDTFEKINGTWYDVQRIKEVVLDGSENWLSAGTFGRYNAYYISLLDSISVGSDPSSLFKCDKFHYVNGTLQANEGGAYRVSRNFLIFTTETTVTDFKSWLSTHNTILQYELEEPTLTPITDTDTIEALETIRTYTGLTEITSDIDLTGSYVQDITNGFDATKTQVLKNVNGTLIWLDEE